MRPAHVLCDIRLQRAQSNYISTIRSLSMSVAPFGELSHAPAGIVLDYLNCNSNGRGVQEVPGKVAAQGVRCHRQGTPVIAIAFP